MNFLPLRQNEATKPKFENAMIAVSESFNDQFVVGLKITSMIAAKFVRHP